MKISEKRDEAGIDFFGINEREREREREREKKKLNSCLRTYKSQSIKESS